MDCVTGDGTKRGTMILQEVGLESVTLQIEDTRVDMQHVHMLRVDPESQTFLVARY